MHLLLSAIALLLPIDTQCPFSNAGFSGSICLCSISHDQALHLPVADYVRPAEDYCHHPWDIDDETSEEDESETVVGSLPAAGLCSRDEFAFGAEPTGFFYQHSRNTFVGSTLLKC